MPGSAIAGSSRGGRSRCGSPETRQDRIDQAAGTATLALDTSLDTLRPGTGFLIDPTATFALASPQHMASPQTFQSDPSPTNHQWEVNGYTYASVEDLESTLTYQITVVAGVWTYTETFTSSYDITTTVESEAFSSVSGSFSYTFTATGDADGSTWTFVATVNAPVESPTGEGAWSQTIATTDTITNTTNVTANTRSGSRSGSGGASWSYSDYGSDSYSYGYSDGYSWSSSEGWTISSGTASNTKTASGSYPYSSFSHEYSDSGIGWSCSGTITEGDSKNGSPHTQRTMLATLTVVGGSPAAAVARQEVVIRTTSTMRLANTGRRMSTRQSRELSKKMALMVRGTSTTPPPRSMTAIGKSRAQLVLLAVATAIFPIRVVVVTQTQLAVVQWMNMLMITTPMTTQLITN